VKKDWLIHQCALCGEPFPLTAPLYANISGTIHQSQLPCPCETRRPIAPEVPPKPLEEMTPEELERLFDGFVVGRHAVGAKVDLDP